MRKILFYLEPAIFRNDPLFLLPHSNWLLEICTNLSLGESDEMLVMSSPSLCRKVIDILERKFSGAVFQTNPLHIDKVVRAFRGNRKSYAQDLYQPVGNKENNHYLAESVNYVFENFDPDLVIATSENRYLSVADRQNPRRVGTFFIEKAPLPSWAREGRLYLDCQGHQSNSMIAGAWPRIINGVYDEDEAIKARTFFQRLDEEIIQSRRLQIQRTLLDALNPSRETILVALQPDEWLSWEGALAGALKPLDVLGQCCSNFPDFNIVPTFHKDITGLPSTVLSELQLTYSNIVALPTEVLTDCTEALLPVVDHVYTVSSATGLSALLYGKCLISDSFSYLTGGAITTEDFIAGQRSRLQQKQQANLAAFLLGRYCKNVAELHSFDEYRKHKKLISV